jgi:hypothetical protein
LFEKIIQTALKTGHGKVIAQGLVIETMSGGGLLARRSAELEGDDEEKNKNPQHDDQDDAIFPGNFSA